MPELFNVHGFGPPAPVTGRSTWPRVDHGVSGHLPTTLRPFQTRFRCGSVQEALSLAADKYSPVHYAKGTPSPIPLAGHRAPTARKCMVSGTFHSARRRAFHRSIALLVHYRSSRSI
jgi:hypothetical protein